MDNFNFTDLAGFLNWVIYSGGGLMLSSWVLDRIPAFMKLSEKWKKFINFASSLVIVLGFFAVMNFVPAQTLTVIDPFFKIVLGFVTAYGAQQAYHRLTKTE